MGTNSAHALICCRIDASHASPPRSALGSNRYVEAYRTQCVADAPRGLCVLRRVAQEDGFGGAVHAGSNRRSKWLPGRGWVARSRGAGRADCRPVLLCRQLSFERRRQSTLIPAALTTGAQRATDALISAANCSGVLPTGSALWARNVARTSGMSRMRTISRCRRSMISAAYLRAPGRRPRTERRNPESRLRRRSEFPATPAHAARSSRPAP